jgi:two-component system, NarL family, sensor histidine kinase DegS
MRGAATDGDAHERAGGAMGGSSGVPGFPEVAVPAGSAASPGGGSLRSTGAGTLQAGLQAEAADLERELGEIGMLVGQAREEAERHEARRVKAEERVTALENDPRSVPDEVRDARRQLLAQTRRQMLFETQNEVLEGKHRTLTRYRDSLARILETLGDTQMGGVAYRGVASTSGDAAIAATKRPGAGQGANEAVAVLRAQEDLRREIARQIHDGPAQSLANIALQSEIVERLVGRGDPRAKGELVALREMVQATLAATKTFIFDVRPMVLDDLGLVPTLRRSTGDRAERAGIEVDFDSSGTDQRLPADLESGLFRIIDELVAAFLALRPQRVTVHVDWAGSDVVTTVRNQWPIPSGPASSGSPAAELPPALAEMIRETSSAERRATVVAHSLPDAQIAELLQRARALGATLTVLDEGATVEVDARIPS